MVLFAVTPQQAQRPVAGLKIMSGTDRSAVKSRSQRAACFGCGWQRMSTDCNAWYIPHSRTSDLYTT